MFSRDNICFYFLQAYKLNQYNVKKKKLRSGNIYSFDPSLLKDIVYGLGTHGGLFVFKELG